MTQWSNEEFLNTLCSSSDREADACLDALPPDVSLEFAFSKMRPDTELPPVLPEPFVAYLKAPGGHDLSDLSEADWERLRRGQRVFLTHALPMTLGLLAKSLPEGYQAPRLSKVLMISGELRRSTYRRVLGVLQMLVNINAPGSFESATSPDGAGPRANGHSEAALTALRVRLMHAGIRKLSRRTFPDFTERHGGIPVSLEDMLFTIIAFSLHVVQALELLRVPLTPAERDDYYFVWKVYARCMGIHPPGEPMSWAFIPPTLVEAEEFNQSYARRHYRTAEQNPDGTLLARAQVDMMARQLTGDLLRWLAPTAIPRIYLEQLIGRDACRNVGVRPVRLMFLSKWIVINAPRAWAAFWRTFDKIAGHDRTHIALSRIFFQRLIVGQYGGAVTFRVAQRAEEVRELVQGTQPGLEYGRQQFRQAVFPAELDEIKRRRETLGLDSSRLEGPPSTDRGLVGLSLSGGGIRAASFALGAVQALACQKLLKRVDYLSTVSGGGFLGGALSSVLTDPDAGLDGRAFPFNYKPGVEEPPAVRHVRNGSNYLIGNDLLSEIRLPTIILRGFLINGVLFLPYLMLAALATWLAYPFAHNDQIWGWTFLIALLGFLTLTVSYPSIYWIFGRKFTWSHRDRYENLQAMSLAVLALVLFAGLLSGPVEAALSSDWSSAATRMRSEIAKPFESDDAWKWAIIIAATFALLSAGRASRSLSRRTNQLFILCLGVIGPAVMFVAYLLLLVAFARSPLLPVDRAATLSALAKQPGDSARSNAMSRQLVEDLRIRDIGVDMTRGVQTVVENAAWRVTDTLGDAYTIERRRDVLEVSGVQFGARTSDYWFAAIALIVLALNSLWVDVNVSSAHGFYRDRLSRVFLFRARWWGPITPNDPQRLSELGTTNPAVPYHLINTALNLSGERMGDLPGRRSDFFVLSKRFVGSYATGYCETDSMEKADRQLNLGTAMAVSGAAAAPNMGTTTMRPLTFILTLLNVRLGYWVPNPWYVQAPSLVRRLLVRKRPGPNYLVREGLGRLNARTAFVNISDGGHIENLGIYELLRRRCAVIIAIDAEADPSLSCPSLAKLTRYARTDLGLEIRIDPSPIRPDARGIVSAQWAVGTIHYSDQETGYLLYIKSSLTGSEAPYVLDYKRTCPSFPHESTADQFFDESQFEAYRALGFHAASSALTAVADACGRLDGPTAASDAFVRVRGALGLAEPMARTIRT